MGGSSVVPTRRAGSSSPRAMAIIPERTEGMARDYCGFGRRRDDMGRVAARLYGYLSCCVLVTFVL